jgi:hypothetical protein
MNCCPRCFQDEKIRDFISEASIESGDCDFCESAAVDLLDPRELEEKFSRVVDIFTVNADDESAVLLHENWQNMWQTFNSQLEDRIHRDLLGAIFADKPDEYNPLLTQPVEIKEEISGAGEVEKLTETWEQFSNEIKYENRYFLGEDINLELLKNLLSFLTEEYPKGEYFFRARTSDREGHDKDKMGKPPPGKKATAGRANPVGIPYLYVSNDLETVKYECRAQYLDFITIAKFEISEKINVIRLRGIDEISPFEEQIEIEDFVKNREYLKRLEVELSKPLRPTDHKLEYLPSQYLCEFVKSLDYDAIEYGSSVHEGGINLAVFNDDKLEISDTEVHEVSSVDLQTEIVN